MKITKKKQAALNDECLLINNTYVAGADDFEERTSVESEVYCGIFSVSQSEYHEAAKEGLRISKAIVINTADDNGADEVQLDGVTYGIERRYDRGDGYTEIYLKEVNHGNKD